MSIIVFVPTLFLFPRLCDNIIGVSGTNGNGNSKKKSRLEALAASRDRRLETDSDSEDEDLGSDGNKINFQNFHA